MTRATTPDAEAHTAPLPDMIELPRGSFVMGATEQDKFGNMLERPPHTVTIDYRLAVAATPITAMQWATVMGTPPPAADAADLPATGVSWDDAIACCGRLRDRTGRPYRLPSEAEWEYAARAGSSDVFHTGPILSPDHANYLYDEFGRVEGVGRPTPVASYPPNDWGLYDTLGNVAELTLDAWHDTYHGAPTDGSPRGETPPPEGPPENAGLRVVRGGAWDHLPRLLRCAYRDWIARDRRLDNVGLRLVLDLDAPPATPRDAGLIP